MPFVVPLLQEGERLEGMLLSPMRDISRTITVKQLADLLAYLRRSQQTLEEQFKCVAQ